MKVQKADKIHCVLRHSKVRVSGNIIDVKSMETKNNKIPYRRISSEEYVDLETGEIKQYNKTENRSQNDYMKTSMDKLRSIINANVFSRQSTAWLTLTYRENMQDEKKMTADFKWFMNKLRKQIDCKLEYITAVEPQERGAWHMHIVLIRSDNKRLYIPQSQLMQLWGHGGVNIKRIDKSDNLGAYLTAYLINTAKTDENGNVDMKSIKKGMRLHLYPSKMKFYRCSRGIKIPEWEEIPDEKTKAIIRTGTPKYRQIKEILDDENNRVQTIVYEQYNTSKML